MNKIIKIEEGYREYPYYCSEAYPTIGYGQKLGPKNTPLTYYTFKVDEDVADCFLELELQGIREYLDSSFNFSECSEKNYVSEVREEILTSMCYQLGITGFKKFKNMLAAIEEGDWNKAADEALDSKWATQTPGRANRHARVLREDTLEAYKGLLY